MTKDAEAPRDNRPSTLARWIGVLRWAPGYERKDLRWDLVAGVTIAAMLVPQAMAYSLLAGLPPEVGLYASVLPLIAYAIFGASRQLAVGPVAIVSLLTVSALAPYASEGTPEFVAAAAVLALVVGAVHILLGVGRLGFVVNFLSHSVLVGFTAAAAIIIGLSQVKHVLGVDIPRTERFHETVIELGRAIGDIDPWTLAIGAGSIVLLLVLKRVAPRFPGAIAVVVLGTVLVAVLGLADKGVKTVGEIPSSVPPVGVPTIDLGILPDLIPAAIVITLVGFMESIAIAKVFARKHRYEIEANQELVGLGVANAAAGLSGGYPVTGGFSRTAVNADAGARTPLASVVTALLVLLTLLFLTPLFVDLPQAALGAIIIVAVVGLVDVPEMVHIWRVKRSDFLSLVVAFLATLTLGIEIGILVAVVVSLLIVLARISKPHTAVLGRMPGTTVFRNVGRFPEAETDPRVVVLRFDVSLAFANVDFTKRQVAEVLRAEPEARTLVLAMGGVNDIDASAQLALGDLVAELDDAGVEVFLADVKGPVRDVLERAGLWARLEGRVFATVDDAFETATGGAPDPAHAVAIHDSPSGSQEGNGNIPLGV